MPSCTAVQHVEDNVMLVDEEQVTLHLFVELVCVFRDARMAWPSLSPCPANLARPNCFWYEIQNSLRDSEMI